MEFCYQRKKTIIYSEACPEVKLRALANDAETKLHTDCCRLAIKYVDEMPEQVPQWFSDEYNKFCKLKAKDKKTGPAFKKKTDKQKMKLFVDYEKGEHPFINFCAKGYDETEVKDKNGNKKKGPWRKQSAVRLSGLVAIDIDYVENPMAIFERWQKELDFKGLKIYLVYITPRGNGLRVVFRCEVSRGNLIDNQLWMCEKLGVAPDESCKDASRGYFLTSAENILFDNLKEMYEDEPDEEFISRYEPEYRAGHSDSVKTGSKTNQAAGQRSEAQRPVDDGQVGNPVKWHGYDIQSIIDARYSDKLPCADDHNRHAESLKLATDLLLMFDGDKALTQRTVERQPWVQEIIDERDENVAQTVESAAKQLAKREETTSRPYPSKAMQAAIEAVVGKTYREITDPTPSPSPTGAGSTYGHPGAGAGSTYGHPGAGARNAYGQQGAAAPLPSRGGEGVGSVDPVSKMDALLVKWGEEIEGMFNDFPMLKDVCAGLKRTQYPAAVFVAGGLMMTLMTRCWYRFYHRPQQERRLNCSLLVIGHPASNKSMADDLYKILAAPMVTADRAGKKALNRYKEDSKKKASNKEGKEKPKGLIRIHPARTSNGQLITDMLNAIEDVCGKEVQLHMFTFDTELDNSIQLQKGGSWIDKQTLELKAFHNEEDGQMYANLDSPVDNFNVTWNYIYTGTPLALKKKVNERNFGTGLSTRLAVLPMPKTNFEMIDFEEVQTTDWQRIDRMKAWAFKLDTRMGELPMWDLVKRLYQWTKNRMADAQEDDSEANELMLKRVPYHALNYAAPFIDMRHWDHIHQDGKYWTGEYETDETDWRLCELLANIQYATQQHFFGKMAEKYFDDMNSDVQTASVRHVRKTIEGYDRLPEVFTREDVSKCFGYEKKAAISMKIRRLLDQHLIEVVKEGKGQFKKTNQMLI